MKRISTFLLALIATLSFSFADGAEMVIRSQYGSFHLKVDGRLQTQQARSQQIVSRLEPGNHHLAIRLNGRSQKVLQFDRVYLPHNQRIIFELVRRGRHQFTLEKVANEPLYEQSRPRRAGSAYPPSYPSPAHPSTGMDPCYSPMHPSDFSQAMQLVRNSRAPKQQLRSAKQIIRSSCLSSRQIGRLMKAMDYEEHALQIAKLGWERVVDPENFQLAEQQLDRRAYRRSLQDYIQYHPRQNQLPQDGACCNDFNGSSCSHHNTGGQYEESHGNEYEEEYYGGSYSPAYEEVGRPMSNQEFRLILRDIRNTSFDRDKLFLAKQSVERNPLSSNQVAQLMEQLSFEKDRLELAKYAYRFVTDPQRYHNVKSALSYSSSKRVLDRMIR